jgi:hypothetical protein
MGTPTAPRLVPLSDRVRQTESGPSDTTMNPTKKTPAAVRTLVASVRDGMTLTGAAAVAGVHISTVCRWQADDPALRRALREAHLAYRIAWFAAQPRYRPRVPWHPDCPACGAGVAVRRAFGICYAFWRCSQWPWCRWASWRPRHPADCPACGGPRYWSHSRKTVSCSRCQTRITTH